jgi:hypothetical protein
MAWQQRVGGELTAHRKTLDNNLGFSNTVQSGNSLYDFYQSILKEQQEKSK